MKKIFKNFAWFGCFLFSPAMACDLNLVKIFEQEIDSKFSLNSPQNSEFETIHLKKLRWQKKDMIGFLDKKFYQTYQNQICNMGGVLYSDWDMPYLKPFGVYEIKFKSAEIAKTVYEKSHPTDDDFSRKYFVLKPRKVAIDYRFSVNQNSLFIYRVGD